MRVKCLAQEHNTMSSARTRTRAFRSGVERSNHKATALPRPFTTVEKMRRTGTDPLDTDCGTSEHMEDLEFEQRKKILRQNEHRSYVNNLSS